MRRRFVGSMVLGAVLATALSWGPDAEATPEAPVQSGDRFDATRAFEHLGRLVAIGPRPSGSPALRQTRAYITRQLGALGLTVQEQPFTVTTPIGRVDMVNLIVRLPGERPDRILVAGHYDTKLMKGATFVGANDGGSSAAFLIELARVLASRPRAFTYELIWLDGEEAMCTGWTDCGTPTAPDNTYGSRHYVASARQAGALAGLGALLLVDMIGDRNLEVRRDRNSTPWLVDLVWEAAARRGHGRIFVEEETAIEDDHLPFLAAGVPAIDIIDLDYPAWHTPADTLDQVSAASLQIVADVLLDALPSIERRLAAR